MPYKDREKRLAYFRGIGHPRNDLHRKLGLTRARLYEVLEAQGWACAICGKMPNGKLDVDHCHATGKFRGMLCKGCNTALGKFKDSPALLARAIIYLLAGGTL